MSGLERVSTGGVAGRGRRAATRDDLASGWARPSAAGKRPSNSFQSGGRCTTPYANVAVTVENAAILVRITNPELVHLIFGARPETVAIHSKTPAADYQIVRVIYRD